MKHFKTFLAAFGWDSKQCQATIEYMQDSLLLPGDENFFHSPYHVVHWLDDQAKNNEQWIASAKLCLRVEKGFHVAALYTIIEAIFRPSSMPFSYQKFYGANNLLLPSRDNILPFQALASPQPVTRHPISSYRAGVDHATYSWAATLRPGTDSAANKARPTASNGR